MVYRHPHAAPQGRLPEERRGRVVGCFCTVCGSIYPLHRARHSGKPIYGRDHVASPCAHEGDAFQEGAGWWDYAVEVLPELHASVNTLSETVGPLGDLANRIPGGRRKAVTNGS